MDAWELFWLVASGAALIGAAAVLVRDAARRRAGATPVSATVAVDGQAVGADPSRSGVPRTLGIALLVCGLVGVLGVAFSEWMDALGIG